MKWADWLIIKETDSYFDLTDAQNKELKEKIQKDLVRLKKESFPPIAKYLRKIADHVETGKITLESVTQLQTEALFTIKTAFDHFQPTALDFAVNASPDQIEHFKKKYKKETDKRSAEVKTEKDKFKFQKKRFKKWTDEWLGDLNSDQEKALDEHIRSHPSPWDLQIRSREFSLNKFLEARKSRSLLKAYMDQVEEERDPEYEVALKQYQLHLKNFILKLYQSLTKEQKDYLLRTLKARAQEFEDLAPVAL